MVDDAPVGAYPVRLKAGTVNLTWTPQDSRAFIRLWPADPSKDVTLNNTTSLNYTASQDDEILYFGVFQGGSGILITTVDPPSKDQNSGIITTTATCQGWAVLTFTNTPGVPALTGIRFRLFMGEDNKPDDMAIQVLIAPLSNKNNYFAGYQQVRSALASGISNDAMNQPMLPFPAHAPTTVDMKMLRPVTPDDLNAIVQFWVDPQSGSWLSHAAHITFSWALVPQWNHVWVDDNHLTNTGVIWTLGRETGQPSYAEQPLYIDPSNR